MHDRKVCTAGRAAPVGRNHEKYSVQGYAGKVHQYRALPINRASHFHRPLLHRASQKAYIPAAGLLGRKDPGRCRGKGSCNPIEGGSAHVTLMMTAVQANSVMVFSVPNQVFELFLPNGSLTPAKKGQLHFCVIGATVAPLETTTQILSPTCRPSSLRGSKLFCMGTFTPAASWSRRRPLLP